MYEQDRTVNGIRKRYDKVFKGEYHDYYQQLFLREDVTVLLKAIEKYEIFEDDIRDVMDFIPKDKHYDALNEALRKLIN